MAEIINWADILRKHIDKPRQQPVTKPVFGSNAAEFLTIRPMPSELVDACLIEVKQILMMAELERCAEEFDRLELTDRAEQIRETLKWGNKL